MSTQSTSGPKAARRKELALKSKPQSHLHLPRRTRSRKLTQRRAHLVPIRIETSCSVERTELGMVERVVHLQSELKPERLSNREILEQGKIPVLSTRTAQECPSRITQRPDLRQAEHICAEVLRKPAAPKSMLN